MSDVVTQERIAAALNEVEQAARSIDDSVERLKELSLLAACVTPSDPARAAALWDEAEQAAEGLADEHERGKSLEKIARSACREDPDRAERIVLRMLGFGLTGPVYFAALLATFASQPGGVERAARIVAQIEDPAVRERILQDARHQPNGFGSQEILVDLMPPGAAQTQGRRQLAEQRLWSSRLPLATQLSSLAAASDPASRLHQLGMIAFGMAERRDAELPQALELLFQALDAVEDADARSAALDEPAFVLAEVAPETAARLLPHLCDPQTISAVTQVLARKLAPLDPDRAEQIALAEHDPDQRDYALTEFAAGLVRTDPDRAERIVARIADPQKRTDAVVEVAIEVAEVDPDRAERLVAGIEDVEARDGALRGLIWCCTQRDLERGLRIVANISGPESAGHALEEVASYAARTDTGRAEQLIATLRQPERRDWARYHCIDDDLARTDPAAAERFAAAVIDPAIRAGAWLRLVEAWLKERERTTA